MSKGEKAKKNVDDLSGNRKVLLDKEEKTAEFAVKYGTEIANSCDPLTAAISVGGKTGVGAALSKFSASQCAGLVGVIVSSITPQVLNYHLEYKFITFY